jgi:hypothetical protein
MLMINIDRKTRLNCPLTLTSHHPWHTGETLSTLDESHSFAVRSRGTACRARWGCESSTHSVSAYRAEHAIVQTCGSLLGTHIGQWDTTPSRWSLSDRCELRIVHVDKAGSRQCVDL